MNSESSHCSSDELMGLAAWLSVLCMRVYTQTVPLLVWAERSHSVDVELAQVPVYDQLMAVTLLIRV